MMAKPDGFATLTSDSKTNYITYITLYIIINRHNIGVYIEVYCIYIYNIGIYICIYIQDGAPKIAKLVDKWLNNGLW